MKYLLGIAISIIVIVIVVSIALNYQAPPPTPPKTYSVTVTDKQVKRTTTGKKSVDMYMIYTELENGEVRVFKDVDDAWKGKYNSSDIYAMLKVGKKYILTVTGYRNQVTSSYENILEVKEIKGEEK